MISVIVPTFNRPDSLQRAVRSLFAQTLAATGFTLIIVDNTPHNTASQTIATLRSECPESITLITLHEPVAGVANARNAAMSAVKGSLVAFLDDDQSAPADWLERLLAAHEATPAAVTFGPVRAILPDESVPHAAYFRDFFARAPGLASGYIRPSFGCGNALLDLAQIDKIHPWFDPGMNETGGEDDILFARIHQAGGRFAWAADAGVFEHPPRARVSLAYTLRRAFSYGQSPISLALRTRPRRYAVIPVWMAIGAGKALWHGAQWIALSLISHEKRAYQLDRAIRGLSKLLWWVDLKFYGRTALRTADAARSVQTPNATVRRAGRA